jgi:hypothetical protein
MENDLISRSALLEESQVIIDIDGDDYFVVYESDIKDAPAVDAVDIEKALAWLEDYSILDRHEVYTNGVLLVPLFRVEQALVDKAYNGLREG